MTRSGLVRDNKPIKKRQYKKKETQNNESNQEPEPSLNLVLHESVTDLTLSCSKRRKIDEDVESNVEDNASDDEVDNDEDRLVEEEVDEDGCESCKDEDENDNESEIEIETEKKIRKRECYIPVSHFSTHESLDTFIRSNNKFPMKIFFMLFL